MAKKRKAAEVEDFDSPYALQTDGGEWQATALAVIEKARSGVVDKTEAANLRDYVNAMACSGADKKRYKAIASAVAKRRWISDGDLKALRAAAPAQAGLLLKIVVPRCRPRNPAPMISLDERERKAREVIAAIGKNASRSEEFLQALAELARHSGSGFKIHPVAFMHKNSRGKACSKGYSRQQLSTWDHFARCAHDGAAVTMGLAIVPTLNPVGRTVAEIAADPMHACAVLIVHPTAGHTARNTYALLEVNIVDNEGDLGVQPAMKAMLKRTGGAPVWVNTRRAESNDGGDCLALALEFMLELVVGGVGALEIARDGGGVVTGMHGFRRLLL